MEKGRIKRGGHRECYTKLPNSLLQSRDLSFQEKGLLAFLLSLPDDWIIYKTNLHTFTKDGRDSCIKAFDRLIETGYVIKEIRKFGNLNLPDYLVYDEPQENQVPENQVPENQVPENQVPENQVPENQELQINKIQTTQVKTTQQQTLNQKTPLAGVVDARNELEKKPNSYFNDRIAETRADLLRSRIFSETLRMGTGVDESYYKELVHGFCDEQLADVDVGKTISNDLRSHFKNWFRVQINLGQKSKYYKAPKEQTTQVENYSPDDIERMIEESNQRFTLNRP